MRTMLKAKNYFFIWLGMLVVAITTLVGLQHQSKLFEKLDVPALADSYGGSQYILGNQAIKPIDDETLYRYAGQAYIRGEDPTTINFEHPTLGKYFFGLSWRLTNFMLAGNLFWFASVLFLFGTLLRRLKLHPLFSYAAVVYFALGSGLAGHVSYALLDTQILCWSLLFFNVLLWPKETWWKYGFVGVTLGAFMATKYFFPILFLFAGLLLYWGWHQKTLLKTLLSFVVMILVYLLSYGAYFWHGHSLIDFIQFEWFRFRWWTGNRTIPRFLIFETLFTGQYTAWWLTEKGKQASGDWNLSWPVLFVSSLSGLSSLTRPKLKPESIVIIGYCMGLLGIYALGSAVYGRYLLQLIPFWLIMLGWGGQFLFTKFQKSSLAPSRLNDSR